MRVVYVTSDVTYVKDNYQHLIREISNPANLPEGVEVVGAIMLKIPFKLLAKNILGLTAIGAPGVGLALLRNLTVAKLNDPRVKTFAEHSIPVFRCKSVNQPMALEFLRELKPDLIVNMRTRNIYKKPVLELPEIGCINIHHGLLPDNRGTMCDLWAWIEKRPVGFSIHWMNEKIDDGDIIARREVDTTGCRSYIEIPFRSSRIESSCLIDVLANIAKDGRKVGIPNRTEKENYTRNPDVGMIGKIRRRGFKL